MVARIITVSSRSNKVLVTEEEHSVNKGIFRFKAFARDNFSENLFIFFSLKFKRKQQRKT